MPSRFFPHTPYAEDQPLYHTVLTVHVLHRGFQIGAFFGLLSGFGKTVYKEKSQVTRNISKNFPFIIRNVGYGSVIGTGFLSVVLPFYMKGKTEIEWKDRSWRLLENRGQLAVDDWSAIGMLAGMGTLTFKTQPISLGWKEVVGRAGLGSLAGVVGYMVWSLAGSKHSKIEKL